MIFLNYFKKLLGRSEIRYVITGCATFLIDNLFFNLHIFFPQFTLFGISEFNKVIFNIIGMIAGLLFGFFVNRNWSFKATGNVSKQFFRCVLLFVFNLIVSSIAVGILGTIISRNSVLAVLRIAVSITIGIWNFFAYKLFVYK